MWRPAGLGRLRGRKFLQRLGLWRFRRVTTHLVPDYLVFDPPAKRGLLRLGRMFWDLRIVVDHPIKESYWERQ